MSPLAFWACATFVVICLLGGIGFIGWLVVKFAREVIEDLRSDWMRISRGPSRSAVGRDAYREFRK